MKTFRQRLTGVAFAFWAGTAFLSISATAQSRSDLDPVAECLEIAGPGSDGKEPYIEIMVQPSEFLEAVSFCGRALARSPGDHRLQGAMSLSVGMMKRVLFGQAPLSDSEALGKALTIAWGNSAHAGWAKAYLGLAFEFGIGTSASIPTAIGWYRRAVQENKIESAAFELARLE